MGRVHSHLSVCGAGYVKELLEWHLIIGVKWIGGGAALELNKHLHPLEGREMVLRVACACVIEHDVWFVLCVFFDGGVVGCVECFDCVADLVCNLRLDIE